MQRTNKNKTNCVSDQIRTVLWCLIWTFIIMAKVELHATSYYRSNDAASCYLRSPTLTSSIPFDFLKKKLLKRTTFFKKKKNNFDRKSLIQKIFFVFFGCKLTLPQTIFDVVFTLKWSRQM